jgi:hypothetical protein
MLFKNNPVWEQIQRSIKYITYVDQNVMKMKDEDELLMNLRILKI